MIGWGEHGKKNEVLNKHVLINDKKRVQIDIDGSEHT